MSQCRFHTSVVNLVLGTPPEIRMFAKSFPLSKSSNWFSGLVVQVSAGFYLVYEAHIYSVSLYIVTIYGRD
jgi:hypothetical protein